MQLSRLALSYSSGLLASLSPCVVVLLPLLLVRFLPKEQQTRQRNSNSAALPSPAKPGSAGFPGKDILLFLAGFQVSYLTFGLAVSSLLSSSIQNGIFLGMGSFFTLVGVLGFFNALDPLQLPLFQKPFYFGLSFAMLISVNPCTVPFLAVIISLSTVDALVAMMAFGQGILTPAIVFILLGSKFSQMVRSSGGFMHKLNRGVNVIVIGTGIYLSWTVRVISFADLAVALAVRFGVFYFAMQRVRSHFENLAFTDPDDDSFLREMFATPDDGKPKGPNSVDLKTRAVRIRLLLLEITSGLVSLGAFLLGAHSEETHEALNLGSYMDLGDQDEDSSSCVDLSQVPPCWRCTAATSVFMLANLLTCIYVGSLYFKSPAHAVEHAAEPLNMAPTPFQPVSLAAPASPEAQEPEAAATPFRMKLRSRDKLA